MFSSSQMVQEAVSLELVGVSSVGFDGSERLPSDDSWSTKPPSCDCLSSELFSDDGWVIWPFSFDGWSAEAFVDVVCSTVHFSEDC